MGNHRGEGGSFRFRKILWPRTKKLKVLIVFRVRNTARNTIPNTQYRLRTNGQVVSTCPVNNWKFNFKLRHTPSEKQKFRWLVSSFYYRPPPQDILVKDGKGNAQGTTQRSPAIIWIDNSGEIRGRRGVELEEKRFKRR